MASDSKRGNSRRTVLKAAGGLALAGGSGLLWRAWDQRLFGDTDPTSLQPWREFGSELDDGPGALVRAAVLAPSPHNTQPWRFRLVDGRIDLLADGERHLGALDADRRELQIGLGCALENLHLAAAPHGYLATVTLSERTESDGRVASVALSSAPVSRSPWYDAIPRRHTNRGPYRPDEPLSPSFLVACERAAAELPETRIVWWRAPEERRAFALETVAASEAIVADVEQATASALWIRFDADAVERHRDGLGVDSLGVAPAVRVLLKLVPTPGRRRIDESWLRATREVHTATAPVFGAIVVRDDRDLRARLEAGRLWQRIQLAATVEGLAGQPLSQLVERRDRERELGLAPRFGDALVALVGDAGWSAALPFRLGRPLRAALPSPRRPASAVTI